jgi:uncharacterized protein YqhQ
MSLLSPLLAAAGENVLLGGQAVIEGVMMRSPDAWAVAVRRSDGSIVTTRRTVVRLAERYPLLKWPLVRGVATLLQALSLGMQSLNFSAEQALLDEHPDRAATGPGRAGSWAVAGSLLVAMAMGIAIFLYLPLMMTEWLREWLPLLKHRAPFNLVDGLLRLIIFLVYIGAISLMRDIRRLFQYHGAEHKVVYTYEAGQDLTVENARRHSTLHPRCGTSFLLFVMVVSVLVFAFVSTDLPFAAKLASRLACAPLIAGISYEAIRLSAVRRRNPLCAALIRPGLWLQRLTTREPSDDQLAVAIQALLAALGGDGRPRGEFVPL